MERPEPVPMPPGSSAMAKAGRPNFSFSRRRDETDDSGMPAFGGGHDDGALFLNAERGTASASACASVACSIAWRSRLSRSSSAAIFAASIGSSSSNSLYAEIGAADAAAGIDARPEQKAKVPGFRRPGQPRHVHQADMACPLAPAQRDQALGDKGAVEPDQRHDVGDGAERNIVKQRQQIRLGPPDMPKAAPAQHAVERDDRHEDEPDRGEMAEPGQIVAPVRIDDGDRGRQFFVGLMVIDDDGVEAELFGFYERLDAGRAAIDADEKLCPALGERPHRLDIRAVTFEQTIGNVDDRREAALAQIARQQRRRGGAIDIVIAENGHALAARHRVGNTLRRLLHGGEHMRIGHRVLDGRVEERGDRVGFDVAAGEDARQEFGKLMPLRYVERAHGAALVEPVAPSPPGRRVFDAKEEATLSHPTDCRMHLAAKLEIKRPVGRPQIRA